MRILLPVSLLLVLASPARTEEPPKTEPKPTCEVLVQSQRPEEPEAAALWDGCQPHAPGGSGAVPNAAGSDEQESRRTEASEAALHQARTRIARLTNPFADRAPDGTFTAGGLRADVDRNSPAAGPPAWAHSVGAGGSARLDNRPEPPLSRIDQAFADVAQTDRSRPAFLAANAVLSDIVPSWPVDWVALSRGLTVGKWARTPVGPMDFSMPKVAAQVETNRSVPEEGSASPSFGAGITGTSNKNIAAAIPTMNFKAGVDQSFIAALGASSWIQGITMSVTPGKKDKGMDHSTLVRVDLGEGRVNGFIETGYEERHFFGRTPQGKSVSGMNAGIPVRVGATYRFQADDR